MKNILKIIKISKPLYHLLVVIAVLILVTAALDLVAPILFKYIVDEIVASISQNRGNLQTLIILIGLSFASNLTGIILSGVSDRMGDHTAGRLRKLLTEQFYNKVLTLPQSYFDSEISGKIINQLTRGITVVQEFINVTSNFILPAIIQSVFTIIVMAKYSPLSALFVFILFPIYIVISHYSSKKWGVEEVKKNKFEDISRGRIQEVIANIKVVKSFVNEQNEYNLVSTNLEKINEIYAGQSTYYHIFDFFRNLSLIVVFLIVSIIVFINTYLGKMTIGEMVLILQLINQIRRPLFAMSFILTRLQTAESGSKEFFEILALPSKEDYQTRQNAEKIKNPGIEFKKVVFKYEKSDTVLDDISFKIGNSQTVALVGPSGTGKTTVVNLILKFYDPVKGEIFLNNKSYHKLNPFTVRNNISLVFQENELFSSNIRENVSYGNRATEEQIIKALKEANAYEFVKKLPNGLDTEVGERGIKLSGGQKQRIQIARAILKNSPILILDEATSNLDARSEMEVQKAMENLMKGRLTIIIAHRFSTIQNVDKIIVLDQGKVVDFGTPKELANKPGVYSDLLRFQMEGNKKLLEKFEIY